MGEKKVKQTLLSVDERGRVTLPAEVRQGIETFAVEHMKDGSIKLIPQEVVNAADAALLKSLKKSVAQAKRGEIEDVPEEWID